MIQVTLTAPTGLAGMVQTANGLYPIVNGQVVVDARDVASLLEDGFTGDGYPNLKPATITGATMTAPVGVPDGTDVATDQGLFEVKNGQVFVPKAQIKGLYALGYTVQALSTDRIPPIPGPPVGSGDDTIVLPPTPQPLPTVISRPVISSDGTPQVGETLTGVSGGYLNGSVSVRRWMLGSTSLASGVTFIPQATETITYQETVTGPGGSITATSDSVTIAAATLPPPTGAMTADVSFRNMATAALQGEVQTTLTNPAGPLTITPNDGRFVEGPQASGGRRTVVRGGTAVSPGFLNLSVSDGVTTVKLAVIIADAVPEITMFRNVIDPGSHQWFVDYCAKDALKSPSQITGYTHMTVKSGFWDDPAVWGGSVPHGYQPITTEELDPETLTFGSVTVGTAVCMVMHVVVMRDSTSVKDIMVMGDAALLIIPRPGTNVRLYVDTEEYMGLAGIEHDPVWTSATPRVDVVYVAHQAPGATTRLGRMMMGPNYRMGSPIVHVLDAVASLPQGATTVHLPGLATSGWQVGHTVVTPSTRDAIVAQTDPTYVGPTQFLGPFYDQSQGIGIETQTDGFAVSNHQYLKIVAMDLANDLATFDQGLSEEKTWRQATTKRGVVETIPPIFVNVSRSIRFRSADPRTLQGRAHSMGMYDPNSVSQFGRSQWMGRTAVDPSMVRLDGALTYSGYHGDPSTVVVTDPNNVPARYGEHVHNTGPFLNVRAVTHIGWVLDEPPVPGHPECRSRGRAIVTHSSKHFMHNLVTIGHRASGWISEIGDELSQLTGRCIAIGHTGDGFRLTYGLRHQYFFKHNGHSGVGFENQSRQIWFEGEAYGCKQGWLAVQQDVPFGGGGTDGPPSFGTSLIPLAVPDPLSMRYNDPFDFVLHNGAPMYGKSGANPIKFRFTAVGCDDGIRIFSREETDRSDQTPLVFEHFNSAGCNRPFFSENYVNNYGFLHGYHIRSVRAGTALSVGGGATWSINYADLRIDGFDVGVTLSGVGYVSYAIDLNGDTPTLVAPLGADQSGPHADPRDDARYSIMGQTYGADGVTPNPTSWPVIFRKMKVYDSAVDLPDQYPRPNNYQTNNPTAHIAPPAIDPRPAGQRPTLDFWLDPSSVTTCAYSENDPGSSGALQMRGILFDSVGRRPWETSWNSDNSFNAGAVPRTGGYRPSAALIRQNGCFVDGSTPASAVKVRCWMHYADRSTGYRLDYYVDVTVTGTPDAVRDANLVDPNATKQDISKPELFRTDKPALDLAIAPVLLDYADGFVKGLNPGDPIALPLRSTMAQTSFMIGGADAANLKVAATGGQLAIIPVADPGGAVNWHFTVTPVSPSGVAGAAVAMEIRRSDATYETHFTDFTGDLAAQPKLQAAGVAGGNSTGNWSSNGDGTSATSGASYSDHYVLQHDTGSATHYVEVDIPRPPGDPRTDFGLVCETNADSFVFLQGSYFGSAVLYEAANLSTSPNVHKIADVSFVNVSTVRLLVKPGASGGVGEVHVSDASGEIVGAFLSTPVTATRGGLCRFTWAGATSGNAFNPQYTRLKIAPGS